MTAITLRPYQEQARDLLRAAIRAGRRRPVCMSPTGSGKTVLAGSMIASAVEKGLRTAFLCDSVELVEQAVGTFDRLGLPVGVMQGQHPRYDPVRLVQVCTAQTVGRRIERRPEAWTPQTYPIDLVLHDECHVQYRARDLLADAYPRTPVIGLSATPFSRGMGEFYDDLIVPVTMQDLIDDGYLVPFRVYAPSQPDMTGVATGRNGDYREAAAAERYTAKLHADLIDTWRQYGEGRQTIGFACTINHARQLADEFRAAGIRAMSIDSRGSTPEDRAHRAEVIERFRGGEFEVLWNVALLTKGFDMAEVGCLIDARPTKSLALHVQKWGRGLRVGGPEDCVILDHAGNVERLGFPTDPLPATLCDGRRKRKGGSEDEEYDEEPRSCTACGIIKPPRVAVCPACGFEPQAPAWVDVETGELVPVEQRRRATKDDKQRWYSELRAIANSNRYANGWVAHKYREVFGVWPRGMADEPLPPSDEVRAFVRAQSRGYAAALAESAS